MNWTSTTGASGFVVDMRVRRDEQAVIRTASAFVSEPPFLGDNSSHERFGPQSAPKGVEETRRLVMKRTIAPATLVIVFATVFVLGIQPRAQAGERRECSDAILQGSFGFTSTGTLLALPPPLAGPFAEIGRQTFDGRGNTDATATLSANGNIRRVTVQGTYMVNPDCTGSMTLYILPFGVTANLDFVIDDDGAELRAISTGAGAVESRVYRKQFSRGRKEE